jgi:putative membrane protein
VALLLPAALAAHPDQAPVPATVWGAWNPDPFVLLPLLLAGAVYGRGVARLWRRAGVGRGVSRARAASFAAGWTALFAALISPIDALGSALFAAHMVQHLLLTVVAAPLIVLGEPVLAALWAFPPAWRRRIGQGWRRLPRLRRTLGALTHPVSAWTLSVAALWIWHVPYYYDLAVYVDAVHALEHTSFLATALLFWWALVDRRGVLRHAGGAAMLYTFTAAMQSGILGALLTFAGRPWYGAHLGTTAAWGFTPLEDQQLAGVIMWVPVSLIYLLAMGVSFVRWLGEAERRVARWERAGAGATAAPSS